jgi:predicted HD superfamily hydrolase involved in NAD metabolism
LKTINGTLLAYLKNHLDTARYKHTLGTCKTAAELAAKYSVPVEKAELAALLHDAGKGCSKTEMMAYVKRRKLKVPELKAVIEHNPSLLHSYISADIAKTKFNIKDKDILLSIERHTVGAAGMSTLSKIIYVADAIAPDRRFPSVSKMKKLAMADLNKAVQAAMANKIFYVCKKGFWLHPEAVKAWNWMVKLNIKSQRSK